MSETCKWCGLRQAIQHDLDTLPEGDDGNLCWREWNLYAECFEIEERKKEAVPDLLEALKKLEKATHLLDPSKPLQYAETITLMRECALKAIAKTEKL